MNADWIDPLLPKMRCDAGCGLCCGVAPASQGEYDSVMAYARKNGVTPKRQGTKCPFYQGEPGAETCAVYPARPSVCRFFGHTPMMDCPKGYNANVGPRAERFIAITWSKQRKGQPERLLHEAVYSMAELIDLAEEVSGPPGRESFPTNEAYHFAKCLSELGHWKRPMMYVDKDTGETLITGEHHVPPLLGMMRKAGGA